jgi:FdrA protein
MSTTSHNAVRRGFYLDSVALMRLSREIAAMAGVEDAALMMATPANKRILADAGLLAGEGEAATANDLVLAVRATTDAAAEAALTAAGATLDNARATARTASAHNPRSLRTALDAQSEATLALISVPGDYATGEARKALRAGLDVMIFSDNVPLAEEVALKREAKALNRLVMGPDCGTAIIGGVPLAFANRVPRGDIGVIGASGTGTQEVTCLIAQGGRGISQAIGVGGRDLSREVGAMTTLAAIDLLDADAATRHIVLISKPPHPEVARKVLERVGASRKPFTVCFLGAGHITLPGNARAASTLRAAAECALGEPVAQHDPGIGQMPKPRPGAILGLYSGGTLGAEAQLILLGGGRAVASNAPVPGAGELQDAEASIDRIIDLGDDQFTRGRPHPMIDPAVRIDRLRAALADISLSTVLLDVVIGFGAHADPAGQITDIVGVFAGNRPHVVASVTGTEADPQVRSRQVAKLQASGVLVAPSNAGAAELALKLVAKT